MRLASPFGVVALALGGTALVVAVTRHPRPVASQEAAVASRAAATVAAPTSAAPAAAASYRGPSLSNAAAYIPAQCYAQTRAGEGVAAHNGCFVCHQQSRLPNYVNDADAQTTLSFATYATQNRWSNIQRAPAPSTRADTELLAQVRRSNYLRDGTLLLAQNLAKNPNFDANKDGAWGGFTPDCWFAFDDGGFDVDPSGKKTGWRAFASTPLPGMFMPTNGSMGDVMIRLPEAYRSDAQGRESDDIYRINLAIAEAYVRRSAVPLPSTDEKALGSDLDGNGVLGTATRVAFVWPPKPGRPFHYVGQAAALDPDKDGWPVAGLLPRGTEFLHSVRYLDVVDGQVRMAARMKELRYMKKVRWLNYGQLDQNAQAEAREKQKSPDKLKHVFADAERGVTTGVGWLMQGFIEDANGELRPQNVEETTACIGCHGGVGATTDATFAFARKLPATAFRGGWYHPSQHGLEGVAEPKRADGAGEYAHYLAAVGGGDDFRANDEVYAKFFRPDGKLDKARLQQLSRDVTLLLVPSAARALALNRAYLGLVKAQHFEAGRDITLGVAHVETRVEQGASTGIDTPLLPAWRR